VSSDEIVLDDGIRWFTQSELKTWRECKRKWWLGTFRRLQLRPEFESQGAASVGTLVHAGMEARYSGLDWREPLSGAESAAVEMWEEADPERLAKFRKNHVLATIMLEGYDEWLAEEGADQFIKVIAPEQTVMVPFAKILGRQTGLLGKLDQLIEDSYDESLGFIDFKTVQSVKVIPKKAPRDEQFLHYSLLLRTAEPDRRPMGGIWRMLRKVKRTASATPPFYDEYRYRFNKHQLNAYFTRVHHLIGEILAAEAELQKGADPLVIMPPTPNESCDWKCEFKDVCPMFDNGDRVEDYVEEWYTLGNPLRRYNEKEEETG